MTKKLIAKTPIAIGAGAIYPYDEEIIEACAKMDRFGEPYNVCRVIGTTAKRVLVPRNMATGGTDLISKGLPYKFKSKFIPRDGEQARVISETVQLLAKGFSFVVEAPTGFGKTMCAMDIVAKTGKKTLIVVTKEDIRDQWRVAAEAILGLTPGKGLGFIQGDTFQVAGNGVVIALIQSLAKEARYNETLFKEFGLVVWDEVHRVGADFFSQSAFRIPAALRLGLSATPDRKDGREFVIKAHIGPIMVQAFALPLTPRVIARRSSWRLPMVMNKEKKVVPLPHSPGRCGHVINMIAKHHGRNSMIANFVGQAYKKGRTILVQSDRKEHLETLASMIGSCGVPPANIGYYIGGLTEAQRDTAKGKRVIMATFAMTAEATDIPWLDTLVMATPKSDVRQIVGRILRTYPDKKDPVVFDIIDATSNVFRGYWNARKEWYAHVSAEVNVSD
jgi:superfamily II DNA or RNA helicase